MLLFQSNSVFPGKISDLYSISSSQFSVKVLCSISSAYFAKFLRHRHIVAASNLCTGGESFGDSLDTGEQGFCSHFLALPPKPERCGEPLRILFQALRMFLRSQSRKRCTNTRAPAEPSFSAWDSVHICR